MKITQEKLPASQIGLEIEVPAEMSKNAYEQVVQKYTRSARIPGFRTGKVPRQVILQRLGQKNLKAEALEGLINNCLKTAIESEKIEAIGNYQLISTFDDLAEVFEPGKSLTFKAAVDVPPVAKLGDYKALQVKVEEITYDPAEVDRILEQKRTELAQLIPVDGRPSQSGDVVQVDFTARFATPGEDGVMKELPGGSAKDFQVELSEGRFIPGFIEGIIGMNAGETRELAISFPDDYPQEELAGEPVVFTVTLKDIKGKELPELDDDFAKEISDFETLAALRESLETNVQADKTKQTQANKEAAIEKALGEIVETEIPESMINREVEFLLTQQAMLLQRQGFNVQQLFTKENLPFLRETSTPEAVQRIKQALGIEAVAKAEGITVTSKEIKEEVAKVKESMKKEKEKIDEDELYSLVEANLIKNKTLLWLAENVAIELVPEGSLKTEVEEYEEEEGETDEGEEATPVDVTVD